MTEPLLRVENLDVRYGTSQALFDVSLDVAPGSVLAVLGANGAGKSTLARTASGLVPASRANHLRRHRHHRAPGPQDPQARAHLHPRGQGHLPRPLGGRQPAHGRGPGEAQRTGPGHRRRHRPLPRARGHGARSGRAASRVASNRCWPWPGPWPFLPGSSSPTRCRSGWRRWWPRPCSRAWTWRRKSGITIVLIEQFVHRALQLADHCIILTRGQVGWSGAASQAQQEVLDRYLGEADQGAIASV